MVLSRLPEAWVSQPEARRRGDSWGKGMLAQDPERRGWIPPARAGLQALRRQDRLLPQPQPRLPAWARRCPPTGVSTRWRGLGPGPRARALSPALPPPSPLSKPPAPTRQGTSASSRGATQDGHTTQRTGAASRGARGSARVRPGRSQGGRGRAPVPKRGDLPRGEPPAPLSAVRAHGARRPPR